MYNYKKREIGIIMRQNGWKFHHQTGSHAIYRNDRGQHISIGLCNCNGAIMHKLSKKHNLDLQYRGK